MLPYWRYRQPWRDDFPFGFYSRDLLNSIQNEFDLQARDFERRMQELAPIRGLDGFHVDVDVRQFRPYEITVKTSDNAVVVEGKQERYDEHGFVSRQFTRRYDLPARYDAHTVTSDLSTDGVLSINAPLRRPYGSNDRVVRFK